MRHFNFNQLGRCLFDHAKIFDVIKCPEHPAVGEEVTIGRMRLHKVIYIESTGNEGLAAYYVEQFPDPPYDGWNKVIQYVPRIKGYLFAYLNTSV